MPQLDQAGTVAIPAAVLGRTIFGFDPVSGQLIPVQVNGMGVVATSGGSAGVTALGPTPAPTLLLGLAVGVPLPLAPPAALFMIVQNQGPAGALITVRESPGAAGAGIQLPRFGIFIFDGSYALEVDNLDAAPGLVTITWET